jgi:hypothetical protein
MKPEIVHHDSASQRHTEGLNPAIKILVIECVLIMPNPSDRARHFVGNERTAIGSRNGLDRINGRSSPSFNGRLLSHGGACAIKTKGLVDSGYAVLTVRSVVVHVALARMTLAPSVFVRDDVLRFGKIRRSRV